MAATAGSAPRAKRVLFVSSFVLPRQGGVEQFVDVAASLLGARGWTVRVMACRPKAGPAAANVTIPTRFLRASGWPLPVGGWRTLWREVGETDVVVANGTRHLLPNLAALAARLRGKKVLFVLHGSGAPFSTSSFFYHRVLGSLFERLVSRPALRLSLPVSLSQAGVAGSRRRYGVVATYIPYPLRGLPPAPTRTLGAEEPLRIVWVGRLYGEKDPLGAVAVIERVRRSREATLDVYGSGILVDELTGLSRDRPWLAVRGSRSWEEIQEIQAEAHVCLSTSLRDATQIAILEPLARGIPVVSTQVGDAPGYYAAPSLRRFCVDPRDPDAAAEAILGLAWSYDAYREQFAANAARLRRRHRLARERLSSLLEAATFGNGAGPARASNPAELPVT
jgi:glycosyltransferase involved in cell wall biosynthesis